MASRMASRKILFYQIRPTRVADRDWQFQSDKFVNKLETMQSDQRKMPPSTGDGMIAEKIPDVDIPAIRFSRCRRIGLAFIEKAGVLSPDEVGPDESRAEATHLVFFGDNIVGAEFTRDGLRVSHLISYLQLKAPELLPPNRRLRVAPLYDPKALNVLNAATQVRFAEVKFTKPLQSTAATSSSVSPDVQLAQFADGFNGTRIGFSIGNTSGLSVNRLRAMVAGLVNTYPVSVARAKVRLNDDRIEIVDFIKGHIGTRKDMELENDSSGSVKIMSAYNAIVQAQSELASPIENAVAVYQEEDVGDEEDLEC